MAGFTRSVIVNRPIEEVFDFATDLKNASILLPGVTKTELLTPGETKAGTKFKETRGNRSAVIEIVEYRRPDVYTAGAAMMGMRATYTFRFRTEGVGTRVDMQAEVAGNILWWPFLGLMSRTMEKEDGQYLDRLKAAMENTVAASV